MRPPYARMLGDGFSDRPSVERLAVGEGDGPAWRPSAHTENLARYGRPSSRRKPLELLEHTAHALEPAFGGFPVAGDDRRHRRPLPRVMDGRRQHSVKGREPNRLWSAAQPTQRPARSPKAIPASASPVSICLRASASATLARPPRRSVRKVALHTRAKASPPRPHEVGPAPLAPRPLRWRRPRRCRRPQHGDAGLHGQGRLDATALAFPWTGFAGTDGAANSQRGSNGPTSSRLALVFFPLTRLSRQRHTLLYALLHLEDLWRRVQIIRIARE